jgi:integrase
VQRSTKETDRRKAQKIAEAFEQVARRQISARQVHRVVADLFRQATGEALLTTSIRDYVDSWLARKKPETANSTWVFYTGKARCFLRWLDDRAERELINITPRDIIGFRESEAGRVGPRPVNHALKVLRMIFEDAKRDGVISDNPADSVKSMRKNGASLRRPFSLQEIKGLLAVADKEWRSLILFGLYTGQRLGDLARLTWANVDLRQKEISLSTSKTGRQQIIPFAPALLRHIKTLPPGENLSQPLHPHAYASVQRSGKVGTLSRQFYELMAMAGLVPAKRHRAAEGSNGRSGVRRVSEISFHSFRHTATSLMKNAGVSPAIVQDIVGHESATISANYTHIDRLSKRAALSTMPDVSRTVSCRGKRAHRDIG